MLRKINIYNKYIFIILILLLEIIGLVQLNFLVSIFSIILLFITPKVKFSHLFVVLNFCLLAILIIGFTGFFLRFENSYTFIKDIIFFSKPIAFILLGYLFISKIEDKNFLFNVIVYLSIIFAIYHISVVSYFIATSGYFNVNEIRNFSGKSNIIEMLALILLATKKSQIYFNRRLIRLKNVILMLLITSFVLYFSRNMLVATFLMTLAINGYLRLTPKKIKLLFSVIFSITVLYFSLFLFDIKRDANGIEGFLYKLKIAPAELVSDDKIDKNTEHAILWDKWRGYESKLAIEQTKNSPLSLLVGNGFGALVDLKFEAPLNKEGMRFIPVLHSGYLYVFFKTGLLGLFIYIIFILILLNFANHSILNRNLYFMSSCIAGIGAYYFLSSITITGIYNAEDSFSILLGGFFALHFHYKKHHDFENAV